jgi:hypothetical protein
LSQHTQQEHPRPALSQLVASIHTTIAPTQRPALSLHAQHKYSVHALDRSALPALCLDVQWPRAHGQLARTQIRQRSPTPKTSNKTARWILPEQAVALLFALVLPASALGLRSPKSCSSARRRSTSAPATSHGLAFAAAACTPFPAVSAASAAFLSLSKR